MDVLVFSTTAYRGIEESDSWTSSGTQIFLFFFFFLAKFTTAYVAEASAETISPLILTGKILATTDKCHYNVYNYPLYIIPIFNDVIKT